jgi:hypothetical protein
VTVISKLVNSESELLIKAKNKLDRKFILKRLRENVDCSERWDIYVSIEIPLYDAFCWSSLIIGYNSLSTVEAMLTRRPIIIPA